MRMSQDLVDAYHLVGRTLRTCEVAYIHIGIPLWIGNVYAKHLKAEFFVSDDNGFHGSDDFVRCSLVGVKTSILRSYVCELNEFVAGEDKYFDPSLNLSFDSDFDRYYFANLVSAAGSLLITFFFFATMFFLDSRFGFWNSEFSLLGHSFPLLLIPFCAVGLMFELIYLVLCWRLCSDKFRVKSFIVVLEEEIARREGRLGGAGVRFGSCAES